MARHNVPNLLSSVPVLSACSKEELRSIASLSTEVEVPAGQQLTQQGKTGKEFFLVLEGEARCLVDDREVARFGPGDFFGELALLSQVPRTATVEAVTDMKLLVLNSREFATLLEDNPKVALKMLRRMADRLRELDAAITH
jgi:CRP/FNR family cyclic AMP-dependent transcriptional regulator